MITEIFDYLFALPTEHDLRSSSGHSRNKCKTHASRTMALSLLAELARDCPSNFNELVKLLKPHHVGIAKDATSYENPKILEKSVSGYVGMKNLGSTCYVNSLMQQFFMIPAFRNQLLSLGMSMTPLLCADHDKTFPRIRTPVRSRKTLTTFFIKYRSCLPISMTANDNIIILHPFAKLFEIGKATLSTLLSNKMYWNFSTFCAIIWRSFLKKRHTRSCWITPSLGPCRRNSSPRIASIIQRAPSPFIL